VVTVHHDAPKPAMSAVEIIFVSGSPHTYNST
jgi:hypothetical protein